MMEPIEIASENGGDYAVNPKDLGFEVSTEDILFMKNFEAQWRDFMAENPHLRPRGRRAAKMAVLQKQIEDTKTAERKAGQELERQLEFFEESREALEDTYASEVEYANKLQNVINDRLEKQLDDVAMSEHLMKQTLPWNFFLEAAEMKAIPYVGSSIGQNNDGIRPSARALALIAPDGDDQDIRLRALRMDHALLTTQLALLEKESDRVELTNSSLNFLGKFLTEHNIWGILTKQELRIAMEARAAKAVAAKAAATKLPPAAPSPAPPPKPAPKPSPEQAVLSHSSQPVAAPELSPVQVPSKPTSSVEAPGLSPSTATLPPARKKEDP